MSRKTETKQGRKRRAIKKNKPKKGEKAIKHYDTKKRKGANKKKKNYDKKASLLILITSQI
jgi:hypothetical protein